jgi:type IX secretion system PorP/SprF family membrane protein
MKPTRNITVNSINLKSVMVIALSICVVIFLVANKTVFGQDAIFSQFYANPLYLNPAFTGTKQCTRLNLNYRNQPFPVFGTYSTYSISGDNYYEKLSGGLGFNVFHDNQAALLSHTQAGLFYAWQTQVSTDWNISIGMQASYLNDRIHSESLVFPDQYNPGSETVPSNELFHGNPNSHNVSFSSGFLLYSDRFYSGVSVHHLNRPAKGIFNDEILDLKYSLMAGYEYAPGVSSRSGKGNISFSPNVIVQSQSGFLRFNYGMYAQLENLTAGVWFRHNLQHANTLIFTLGIKQVNYAIGYSYDYSLSGLSTPGGGAHEIGVLLNFNCRDPKTRYRILNCPTF